MRLSIPSPTAFVLRERCSSNDNMPRGKKQNGSGNAQLRQSASTSLFPILRNLGVGAALSDRGALVLHQGVVEPPGYATPRVSFQFVLSVAEVIIKALSNRNFASSLMPTLLVVEYPLTVFARI